MLKFSEIFEFSKEKFRKIPILKEFEWFEWFEWFGPSPIEPFNSGRRRLRAVEAQDLAQHPQEARRGGIAALSEDGVQIDARPFPHAAIKRKREAHVACFGAHAKVIEQRREVRIVQLVVDDEAGVDRDRPLAEVDLIRVGVAAQPVFGFVQHHLVLAREEFVKGHHRHPQQLNTGVMLLRGRTKTRKTERYASALWGARWDGSCLVWV